MLQNVSRLELIWLISWLKIAEMSTKCIFFTNLQEAMR